MVKRFTLRVGRLVAAPATAHGKRWPGQVCEATPQGLDLAMPERHASCRGSEQSNGHRNSLPRTTASAIVTPEGRDRRAR